jgi:hypothetical protein
MLDDQDVCVIMVLSTACMGVVKVNNKFSSDAVVCGVKWWCWRWCGWVDDDDDDVMSAC